ncbi:hypothetical protein SUGI_1010680 [Cryptomeria japonica]|nr:hypothetical protein SUGI_1010680 [Cryptomeria japonica]
MFEWVNDWPSAEERWLHRFIIFLQSCKPRKGIPVETYVVPFYDGLPSGVMNFNAVPSDVVFVQLYADEPNPMDFLRKRHLYIQSLYNSHMSPAVRREQNRIVILHLIDCSNDPLGPAIYDLLFAGSRRMQANHVIRAT